MRQFDEFLARELAEGELVSSGEFTLKLEHALEKLAEMALETKAEWVLKVVQAAVVANTRQLDFRIGRRGIQVDLSGPAMSLQSLRDGLLDPSLEPEPFWAELFVGLRTLLSIGRFQVISGDGDWVEWAEGELLLRHKPKAPSPNTALTIVMVPRKSLNAKQTVEYNTLLETRALYAPLKLRLDSREIVPRQVHAPRMPEFGIDVARWTVPLLYVHTQKPMSELSLEDLSKAKERLGSDPLRTFEPFLSYGLDLDKGPRSQHLYLKAENEDVTQGKTVKRRVLKPSTFSLRYTRLGVVCYALEWSSSIGGVLQLPRDSARTDLGGLSIEVGPDTPSARPEVARLFAILSHSILKHRSSLHYYGSDKGRLTAAFTMTGGAAMVFALIVASNPVTALTMAGIAGCAGASTMLTWGRDDYQAHLLPMAKAVDQLAAELD